MEFKVGCITKFYRNNLVVVNEYFLVSFCGLENNH
jgi:hypothetical protein